MTMPELNGLELSRQLRTIRPDVPIILCSGFSDLIDGDKARALGIDEFLMKPILLITLANTVRKLLDKQRVGADCTTISETITLREEAHAASSSSN